MSLNFDLENVKVFKKDLEEKFCPLAKSPCLGEKCWRFTKMENAAWKEEVGVITPNTQRVKVQETGKICIGTMVKCEDKIFPHELLIEARYAKVSEASIDLKTGQILDSKKQPWGVGTEDDRIIDIKDLEKDEDDDAKAEIAQPLNEDEDMNKKKEDEEEVKRLQALQGESLEDLDSEL